MQVGITNFRAIRCFFLGGGGGGGDVGLFIFICGKMSAGAEPKGLQVRYLAPGKSEGRKKIRLKTSN